ncbi:MAG: Tm-1-like ATP-binding domain-containing protein [Anaerolineae bacterium]|nr:Tm-1-like ATP-binding domain-containing protein [Anaerolineae bacterium]
MGRRHTSDHLEYPGDAGAAGYDSYAVKGEGFYDPAADAAFVAELKANLPPNMRVIERNTHTDDPAFAAEAVELLISLIEAKEASGRAK